MRYYTVWKGRVPGVYYGWELALKQVNRFPGAKYKAFDSEEAAYKAFGESYSVHSNYTFTPERAVSNIEELDACLLIDLDDSADVNKQKLSVIGSDDGDVLFEMWIPKLPNKRYGLFLGALKALEYCSLLDDQRDILVPSKTVYYWLNVKKRMSSKFLNDVPGDQVAVMDHLVSQLREGSFPVRQTIFLDSTIKEMICAG